MSHTCILDKVGWLLVNLPSRKPRSGRLGFVSFNSGQDRLPARTHLPLLRRNIMSVAASLCEALDAPHPERRPQLSRGEDRQKGDLDCERVVNIASELIAQFLQATDAF